MVSLGGVGWLPYGGTAADRGSALPIADQALRIADCALSIAGAVCALPITDAGADCGSRIAGLTWSSSQYHLAVASGSYIANWRLMIDDCWHCGMAIGNHQPAMSRIHPLPRGGTDSLTTQVPQPQSAIRNHQSAIFYRPFAMNSSISEIFRGSACVIQRVPSAVTSMSSSIRTPIPLYFS